MKSSYLDQIRRDSNYPTFRGFIGVAALLGYLVAAAVVVLGLIQVATSYNPVPYIPVVAAGILLAMAIKASKECLLMIADIADCIISDSAARQSTNNKPATDLPRDSGEMTFAEIQRKSQA